VIVEYRRIYNAELVDLLAGHLALVAGTAMSRPKM
jgi:hypothetical protein